ncbi:MAG: TonB-dependent receptor [Gammaproteobacteria bacterium]|jgi:vitamin B12 transporter|nr:TonB-dependent receptor [Gammaproteobacteria bacterium]
MSFPTHLSALLTGIIVMHNVAGEPAPNDNIIVSAHRTPASRFEVGSAVTTIDRQSIENRQSIFATDLLQDLTSLAVSRSSNFGSQTAIRIRGAEANHVLVRIDGIEVNDPTSDDAFDFAHLTANDIEHIEVVRGPQSALWGSDALAGVIDITTRRSTDRLTSSAFIEGGTFSTINSGVHVGTRGTESGIDLTASFLDSDGSNISRVGTEDDGYQNLTANLHADVELTRSLTLDGSLRHVDTTKQFDAIDFTTGLSADADRKLDAKQTTLGGRGKLSLFEDLWAQTLRLTFMTTKNDNFTDGTHDMKTAADKFGVYYQSTFNFDAGPTARSAQQITFAADYEREDFEQRGTASIWGDPNQDQDISNAGFAGEYRATGFGSLSFSLGIRYDNNSAFDDIATYRTTAAWHFENMDSRLHASFGTGQKSPTFTERFGFTPDQFHGNTNLQPEKSRGLDIGYEQYFSGGQIVADLTYFRKRLEDEINGFFFDPSLGAFGMFTAVNRDGVSKSKGLEAEVTASIIAGLSTTASYTYTDATQPDATGQQQREVRRPRHMAALNINYDFSDRVLANLNVSYTGEQTDNFFPPYPPFLETVTLDAYTLVNLTGSYAVTNKVTIFARVENLFNTTYENVYGFATPGVGGYFGARIKL